VEADWRSEVTDFVERVPDSVMEAMLARSLLGVKVSLDDVIEGVTMQRMVEDSVIVNGLNPKSPFVPQLSLLRLHQWCLDAKDSVDTEDSSVLLQVRLGTLLELGQNLQFRSFEEFHLIFEELRCWAWHRLNKSAHTTLKDWLPHAQLVRGEGLVHLTVPPAKLDTTEPSYGSLAEKDGGSVHALAPRNQPGFDIVRRMGPACLLEECRYSEPSGDQSEKGTQLAPAADVRRKAVLAAEEASKANISSPAFVLVAFRNASSDLRKFALSCKEQPAEQHAQAVEMWERYQKLAMPVLVFDRTALMKHYGPTFQRLGGFVLDYTQRNHGAVRSSKTDPTARSKRSPKKNKKIE
jgi:hypothetical protein